jgi:cell division septation protein DedD
MASRPARKKRGVFVSFATLVVVGLGLAGWYVSERIVSAQSQPSSPVPQTVQPVVMTAAPALQETPPHDSPSAPQGMMPLALEYYLQIASLGTSEDASYMKQLEEKGYHTQFDAAGAGHEARILIGPYFDESSLKRAREKLMASGVLAIDYVR